MDGEHDFAAPVEELRENTQPRQPRALTLEETARLLATCPADATSPTTRRDRAILLLGLNCGLRREEMCSLTWDAFERDGATLSIRSKGGATDTVPVDADTAAAICALAPSPGARCPGAADPMLLRAKQPLRGPAARLTVGAINEIVSKRAAQAGLKLAPHEMRHTFVSHALAAGVPPWRVQQAARHRDIATTLGHYAHDPAERGEAEPVGSLVAKYRREGR
jgi:integrase/recombinase XerD